MAIAMSEALENAVLAETARAFAAYRAGFMRGLALDPDLKVSEWADKHRVLSSESSSMPGRWRNELAPYLVEVMDCLSPSHLSREIVFMKSAQVGGSECGLNWFGLIATMSPGPMGIWLPTTDLAKAYVRTKLQPAIDATPMLHNKVVEQKSRDEKGSTTMFKKFPGGYALISGANSSAGMQMFSLRYLLKEEISEWPFDVDGRGDPDQMTDARTKAFDQNKKIFNVSTPGIKGRCRITLKFEASDQRRWYMPCPHCGDYQRLKWENLKYSEIPPFASHYVCDSCGTVIEHAHKRWMLDLGCWIKCYPGDDCPSEVIPQADIEAYKARSDGGRQPGFHINQLSSPFVHWDAAVFDYLKAKGDAKGMKVFTQQTLGEAYEESGEVPDHDLLAKRTQDYRIGSLPKGALFITGAADVQINRIEYAVYGWGIGFTRWLIDKGVLEGDPQDHEVWRKLAEVTERTYKDALGRSWPIDLFGVDTGYRTQRVYSFVRARAGGMKVLALDGRAGWGAPPIGTPTKQDIDFEGKKHGSVMLYPVGTWDLKTELYAALQKTIMGPDENGEWTVGAAHFPDACDAGYFKQITAEFLKEVERKNGLVQREWVKMKDQANEALDIAVYSAALAHHLADRLAPEDWHRLAAERAAEPESAQLALDRYWGSSLVKPEPNKAGVPETETVNESAASEAEPSWIGPARTGSWIRRN